MATDTQLSTTRGTSGTATTSGTSTTSTGSAGLVGDFSVSSPSSEEVFLATAQTEGQLTTGDAEEEVDDLEVETYAELRKKLLESEVEPQVIEEAVETGVEEKSLLETIQEGAQKLWDGIVQWFSNLGK